MGTFSIWHWLIVLAVVIILFGGGGKISRLMGDFGKGLKAFKKNVKDGGGEADDAGDDATAQPKVLQSETGKTESVSPKAEAETTSPKQNNG